MSSGSILEETLSKLDLVSTKTRIITDVKAYSEQLVDDLRRKKQAEEAVKLGDDGKPKTRSTLRDVDYDYEDLSSTSVNGPNSSTRVFRRLLPRLREEGYRNDSIVKHTSGLGISWLLDIVGADESSHYDPRSVATRSRFLVSRHKLLSYHLSQFIQLRTATEPELETLLSEVRDEWRVTDIQDREQRESIPEQPQMIIIAKYTRLTTVIATCSRREDEIQQSLQLMDEWTRSLYSGRWANNDSQEAYETFFTSLVQKLKQLDELTGLQMAKETIVREFTRVLESPEDYKDDHMNIALLGHAGTGKTELSKFISPLYKMFGVVPDPGGIYNDYVKSFSPNDFQSPFQSASGSTTVDLLVKYGLGSVVFIDEAYAFGQSGKDDLGVGSGSGAESLTQLVKTVDEYKGLMLVVVAGYERSMKKFFFGKNPGLESRFPVRINLPDYDGAELYQIFRMRARRAGYKLRQGDSDVRVNLRAAFQFMKQYDNDLEQDMKKFQRDRLQRINDYQAQVSEQMASLIALKTAYEQPGINSIQLNSMKYRVDVLSQIVDASQRGLQSSDLLLERQEKEYGNDPPGLFRKSNARGVVQFFNACVSARTSRVAIDNSARRQQEGVVAEPVYLAGDNGMEATEEKYFTVQDVYTAMYRYTQALLGVPITLEDSKPGKRSAAAADYEYGDTEDSVTAVDPQPQPRGGGGGGGRVTRGRRSSRLAKSRLGGSRPMQQ